MTNLLIAVGLPGSGKSTWAQQHFYLKYSIVSSDAIRVRLFGDLKTAHDDAAKEENNTRVWSTYHRDIRERLDHGIDVYADATHLTSSSREVLREIATQAGATVRLVMFTNVQDALLRNSQRPADTHVPDDVMTMFLTRYYDTLFSLRHGEADEYASTTFIERTL